MTDESKSNPVAILPDASEKPFSLLLVEQYLKQADQALETIKASIEQRQKEFLVVSGQKELLLAMQKNLVKNELPTPNK